MYLFAWRELDEHVGKNCEQQRNERLLVHIEIDSIVVVRARSMRRRRRRRFRLVAHFSVSTDWLRRRRLLLLLLLLASRRWCFATRRRSQHSTQLALSSRDLLVERVFLHLHAPNQIAHRVGQLDVEEFRAQLMHTPRQAVQETQRREFEQRGIGKHPRGGGGGRR